MRLLDREQEILAATELDADRDIAKISKETGYREHTVRYTLNRLKERGVIRKVPFINIAPLGIAEHNVFFSVRATKQKMRTDFINFLIRDPRVVWLAELGGDFQYGLGLAVKNMWSIRNLLSDLSDKVGNIIHNKAVTTRLELTLFQRKYLGAAKKFEPLASGRYTQEVEIDELDDQILSILSAGGDLSYRELAKNNLIPQSTFLLRVEKLKERKILGSSIYSVNSGLFGMQKFRLLIYSRGGNADLGKKLKSFCLTHSAPVYLVESIGSWDFELGVEVRNAEEILPLQQLLFEAVGDEINQIKVVSKFRDLKAVYYPGKVED